MRVVRSWLAVTALAVGYSSLFALAGVPSPILFGTLAGGVTYGIRGSTTLTLPSWSFTLGQAIIGVTMGALVDVDTVVALRVDLWPILGACLVTLVFSVAAGSVFRIGHAVSPATGVFAMIAGGSSGVVAIAHDLGADERVVAVVQYLRVLIVLVTMPIVTAVVFRPERVGSGSSGPDPALLPGIALTTVCCAVGIGVARLVRFPAASLLGPLIVAMLVSVSGWFDSSSVGVPEVVVNVGFALIGIQVGLRFTRESLRAIAALLPRAVLVIAALIGACAALGSILAVVTGASALDAYLATTPGGLYAVLATAIATSSNVTFVLGAQVMRLIVMLVAAPLLARVLKHST